MVIDMGMAYNRMVELAANFPDEMKDVVMAYVSINDPEERAIKIIDRLERSCVLLMTKLSDMDWRQIETAPKDGTEIILSDGDGVECSYWYKSITTTQDFVRKAKDGDVYRAVEHDLGFWNVSDINEPTHWMKMPLPSLKPR